MKNFVGAPSIVVAVLLSNLLLAISVSALQSQSSPTRHHASRQLSEESGSSHSHSRRSFLASPIFAALVAGSAVSQTLLPSSPAAAAELPPFSASKSGLQYADAKVGSGVPPSLGSTVAVDYSMQTTGARYGTKIYSTADKNSPFRFTVGDGTAIRGLEEAVIGGEGIPPMLPGGVRRVIIPSSLGYESLARPIPGRMQYQDCQEGKGVGPIPPVPEAFEEYQRFKNIYCNANRPYQPDLVMDIKLYGKRAPSS